MGWGLGENGGEGWAGGLGWGHESTPGPTVVKNPISKHSEDQVRPDSRVGSEGSKMAPVILFHTFSFCCYSVKKGMTTAPDTESEPNMHLPPVSSAGERVYHQPCQRVPRVNVSTDSTQEEHVQNATTSCVYHC